jgi:hypothetical protein
MALGAGKYDDLCTQVRLAAGAAKGAIVIVFGGREGNGFACQADLETTLRLPELLRSMADSIERDAKGLRN